jgi:hypothetical protein
MTTTAGHGFYDKNSESDYFFFPPPEYFFQQHWESEYFFRKKPNCEIVQAFIDEIDSWLLSNYSDYFLLHCDQ